MLLTESLTVFDLVWAD